MLEGSCLCGQVRWRFNGLPASATACSCTACRRYGALWAYGWEGEEVELAGETRAFVRGDAHGDSLSFNSCTRCGCVSHWRSLAPDEHGRWRVAVNLRLCEPGPIAELPIRHFDGLNWQNLPADGRCVRDMWF